MAKYAWIIDRDLLEDGKRAGLTGPRSAKPELLRQLTNRQGIQFRMMDDDDVVYYEGRIVGDCDGFEPLDDFGEGNAGCTGIDILENGNWKQL
jgi:hypothetical protein